VLNPVAHLPQVTSLLVLRLRSLVSALSLPALLLPLLLVLNRQVLPQQLLSGNLLRVRLLPTKLSLPQRNLLLLRLPRLLMWLRVALPLEPPRPPYPVLKIDRSSGISKLRKKLKGRKDLPSLLAQLCNLLLLLRL